MTENQRLRKLDDIPFDELPIGRTYRYAAVKSGRLGHFKFGRRIYIDSRQIQEFLQLQEAGPKKKAGKRK